MPHVETPQSICRCAVACGDITPPPGIYHRMWGAAAHDRAAGVHRPLSASVIFFQPLEASAAAGASQQQVLIALDHCLLGAREMDGLLSSVSQATGLQRDCLLVVFSHTHAAGLMALDRASLPGGELIAGYLEELNARVAQLVRQARDELQPATIAYARGHCDLAAHRDFRDEASGQFVCGFNPDGAADDTVLVARITGSDDRLLATVVNYACHPTTLAWDNQLISPDYPGAMRETVQQATGAPCVFLQGAAGDLGPRDGFVGDVEVADRNGRQLGYAALSALNGLPPPGTRQEYTGAVVSGATIGTWSHKPLSDEWRQQLSQWQVCRWTLPLDYRHDLPTRQQTQTELDQWLVEEQAALAAGRADQARECRAMAERQRRLLNRLSGLPEGAAYPFQVALWRIGGAFWVAVQGEPYHLLQRELRRRFADAAVVVATVANRWGPSYLPPAELYGQGIYQESIAVLRAGSLEQLIDEIERRMRELS